MLLKNGWTIAGQWYCWPQPTTWHSAFLDFQDNECTSWTGSPTSDAPLLPCPGLPSPTARHQPRLHPWLSSLLSSCHTPHFGQMCSLSSLSPQFKICTPTSQLKCLVGFSVSTFPPLNTSKSQGKTFLGHMEEVLPMWDCAGPGLNDLEDKRSWVKIR